MKVEVQCQKLVRPSACVSDRPRRLNLSSIDEFQTPNYVGVIFFYRANGHGSCDAGATQRLHTLEESLSETLTLFYPLAGRYIEEGTYIDCDDQGAGFIHAKVHGQLDHLLMEGELTLDLVERISQFPPAVAGNPLVLIQVNTFECGGLAISLRFAHKVGDMCSMSMFMNSWSRTCRGHAIKEAIVPPNFALPSLFPMKERTVVYSPPPVPADGERFSLKRFFFNDIALSRLKATTGKARVSRVEVVSALICKALISTEEARRGHNRPLTVCMAMNLRGRVPQLQIPANAFGNFFTVIIARSDNGGKSMLNFIETVNLFGDMVSDAKTKYASITNESELWSTVKESLRDFAELIINDEDHIVPINSWCGFSLYNQDFGWGRPGMISTWAPFKSIYLIDNTVDGGIDAWITLDEDDMTLLEQDPEIVACTSFA